MNIDPPERSKVTVIIEQLGSGVIHTYEFPVVEKVSMDYKPVLPDWQELAAVVVPLAEIEHAEFRVQGEALRPQPDGGIFTYTRFEPDRS